MAPPIQLPTPPRIVDHYQGDNVQSFATPAAAGLLAVIHKATTGATGRDGWYQARRAEAKQAGLLWGAYHWGTARSADDQVQNFLEFADPDDETLVALDYERSDGNQMTLALATDFLTILAGRLGRKPIFYCGGYFKDEMGNKFDSFFGSHRLWLAEYGPRPVLQASWTKQWLWQYTDGKSGPPPHSVSGISGNSQGALCCDFYDGTADALKQEWSGAAVG